MKKINKRFFGNEAGLEIRLNNGGCFIELAAVEPEAGEEGDGKKRQYKWLGKRQELEAKDNICMTLSTEELGLINKALDVCINGGREEFYKFTVRMLGEKDGKHGIVIRHKKDDEVKILWIGLNNNRTFFVNMLRKNQVNGEENSLALVNNIDVLPTFNEVIKKMFEEKLERELTYERVLRAGEKPSLDVEETVDNVTVENTDKPEIETEENIKVIEEEEIKEVKPQQEQQQPKPRLQGQVKRNISVDNIPF